MKTGPGPSAIDRPVVTVLVLTYNQAGTIGRCIESVLCQKTDFAFKVIVVDDASTDRTPEIIREIAARDARVVPVLRERNLFHEGGTRKSFGLIDTEFWIALEGDDWWTDERKLQLQMDALRRHPDCTICAHLTEKLNEKGEVIAVIGREGLAGEETVFGFEDAPYCHTTSRLYRGGNFAASGGLPARLAAGDAAFLYWHLDRGNMVVLNRVMSVYNFSGGGVWSSRTEKARDELNARLFLLIDQMLDFRHHEFFKRRYLPEEDWNTRTLMQISVPCPHGKSLCLELSKRPRNRG